MITTLRPNGAGASAQHSRNGGAANWSRCSEASSDGDTTYIYKISALSGQVLAVDSWNITNPAAYAGAISNVAVKLVARYVTMTLQADIIPLIRIGSKCRRQILKLFL